jgi:hypothetical protein
MAAGEKQGPLGGQSDRINVQGLALHRRQLLANAAIAAYLVRLSHSAIASWMARRSASGIPADLSASASGQPPLRPRRRCFPGADDSGRGPREIIADETMDSIRRPRGDDASGGAGLRKVCTSDLTGRTRRSSFQLRATPGPLHWSLQCPFVAALR